MSSAEQQRKWRASKGARTGQPGRPATAPCGTTAAYKRHLRRGEPVDQMCRDAHAKATRERRQRAKED